MKYLLTTTLVMTLITSLGASEMRHFGDFVLQSRSKLSGEKLTPAPTKPVVFRVSTDGIQVQVRIDSDEETSTFHVYATEGIGRLNKNSGTLEIVPGIQASSNQGGVLRHLRLTAGEMTITSFPVRSDQTVIIHAVAAEPNKPLANATIPEKEL